jgi:hypothetical protein
MCWGCVCMLRRVSLKSERTCVRQKTEKKVGFNLFTLLYMLWLWETHLHVTLSL